MFHISGYIVFSDQIPDTYEDWNRGRTCGPSFHFALRRRLPKWLIHSDNLTITRRKDHSVHAVHERNERSRRRNSNRALPHDLIHSRQQSAQYRHLFIPRNTVFNNRRIPDQDHLILRPCDRRIQQTPCDIAV